MDDSSAADIDRVREVCVLPRVLVVEADHRPDLRLAVVAPVPRAAVDAHFLADFIHLRVGLVVVSVAVS
jgi:hypothetical protein